MWTDVGLSEAIHNEYWLELGDDETRQDDNPEAGTGSGIIYARQWGCLHPENAILKCHLFRVPRDEWIEGLGGARVRELAVDSVTDNSSNVVSSVSGERMGEGRGEGGRTDLTEVTDNSEYTTERLATDPGSGILLVILIVDTDRVGSTVELVRDGGG
jgi:hypothetical protein